MKTLLVFFAAIGSFFQLSAAVIFPTAPVLLDQTDNCSLPIPYDAAAAAALPKLHATIPLKTDSGDVSVQGLVQQDSFLAGNPVLSKVVTPLGVGIPVIIDPSTLRYGENKAYVG